MGRGIDFPGKTVDLQAPVGHEATVSALPIYSNGLCCVSCWQLDVPELMAVVQEGQVWLSVFSGRSMPPVFVGSRDTVRSVVVDYGGLWSGPAPPKSDARMALQELMERRDAMPSVQSMFIPADLVDRIIGRK